MLIGENLHIISKQTKEAIAERNEEYVLDNIKKQICNNKFLSISFNEVLKENN